MLSKLPIKIISTLFLLGFFVSAVHAADLEITCYEDQSPVILRNTDPLFQLTSFLPGDTASRTIYVKNSDPANDCRIYFDISGTTNILTNKITVNIPGLFDDTLSEYISGERILMANLGPNEEITRTIIMTFPSDANNTFTLRQASFDIYVQSEWGPDEKQGEIAGATDTGSAGGLLSAISSALGIGGGEDTSETGSEESNEEEEKNEDSLVLGEEDTGKECTDKTLWWIPLIIQLLLTVAIFSIDKSFLENKYVKMILSLAIAVIAYFVIEKIGCGCNPVWLCEHHWILNAVIGVSPVLRFIEKKNQIDYNDLGGQQTL